MLVEHGGLFFPEGAVMRRVIGWQGWNGRVRWTTGVILLFALVVFSIRLGTDSSTPSTQGSLTEESSATEARYVGTAVVSAAVQASASSQPQNAYFGELHVHTDWSLDAYRNGNLDGPAVAYRYGRGDAITRPDGSVRAQLRVPLDFMAVTDHDLWLGEIHLCEDVNDSAYNTPACRNLRGIRTSGPGPDDFGFGITLGRFARTLESGWRSRIGETATRPPDICGESGFSPDNKCYERSKHLWHEIQRNADAFYQPGTFTTFPAYEFTAQPAGIGHLHRVVIFRGEQVPEWGGGTAEMGHKPERLWEWLDVACTGKCEVLAIPHNTNWSQGVAFAPRNSDGTPFTEEILTQRAAAEPLVEIFQIKGNSECHIGLGTVDEECNFELYYPACAPGQVASEEQDEGCAFPADYVRNALKTGLTVEAQYGVNPFKYGVIASTDDHKSMSGATDEQTFTSKFGRMGVAQDQKSGQIRPFGELFGGNITNPGGLAGVWAAENTRESIFDAMKRREAFGTSGTRIRVRFFGGWTYPSDLHMNRDLIQEAYRTGVPMGADLPTLPAAMAPAPRFVVWATKDADAANLQKIQIIKGWSEGEQTYEEVYDVVCADGLTPDAETHRCSDNRAIVDLSDCSYSTDKGAAELSTTWTDPAFDPADRAFYYARVLENPTCRWTSYRALARQSAIPEPALIKERAWSSPIWYTPVSQ
jgi:hypothetical protein